MIEWLAASPAVDRFDGPEIALVVTSIVGAVSGIVAAGLANRSRQHSQVVRAQVENDHATSPNPNLRVDLDAKEAAAAERDKQTNRKLDRIVSDVHVMKGDLAEVKDDLGDAVTDIGLLRDGYTSNRERIRDLEDTESRRREAADWGPPETRRERRERSR